MDFVKKGEIHININRRNTSKDRQNGTSNYIGVSFDPLNSKWRADISIDGKHKFLGSFIDEKEAANAYQEILKQLNE